MAKASEALVYELCSAAASNYTGMLAEMLVGAKAKRFTAAQLYAGLLSAARFGVLENCKRLVSLGAPVMPAKSLKDPEYPLHLAAREQHLAVCAFLIEQGADPSAQTRFGNALRECCSVHPPDLKLVDLLLAKGASPTARSSLGRSTVDELLEEIGIDWGNNRGQKKKVARSREVLDRFLPHVADEATAARVRKAIGKTKHPAARSQEPLTLAIDVFGEKSRVLWERTIKAAKRIGPIRRVIIGGLDEDLLLHIVHLEGDDGSIEKPVGWPKTKLPPSLYDFDDCEPVQRFLTAHEAKLGDDPEDTLSDIVKAAHDREIAAQLALLKLAAKVGFQRHDDHTPANVAALDRALKKRVPSRWRKQASELAVLLYEHPQRRAAFVKLLGSRAQ